MTTHKGSCHCGKIAYSFEGEVTEALECNCSLCARRGGLLHFVPDAVFTLMTPRADLSTYQFYKHVLDHHFCDQCGIAPFSEGSDPKGNRMVAVNLRCVEGIDPKALTIKFYDGRDQ
jgi:hypothetical protein